MIMTISEARSWVGWTGGRSVSRGWAVIAGGWLSPREAATVRGRAGLSGDDRPVTRHENVSLNDHCALHSFGRSGIADSSGWPDRRAQRVLLCGPGRHEPVVA